jgi:hypothetical protein
MVRKIRRCRLSQRAGPSTGTRFDAIARRIFRIVRKKNVVKTAMRGASAHSGRLATAQRWKRYQNRPVM